MPIDLDKQGQERGCDSDGAEHPGDASAQGAYRARRNDTHLTHGCIPLFRQRLYKSATKEALSKGGEGAAQREFEAGPKFSEVQPKNAIHDIS
jgi:hypothetical protein